ncbi:MAG TPA: DotU family type IV/VI secretion system protein [Gemmataceae bacterium]|nr:DotU family type IV/VI secretion system protein [Gemmataceae bacterium]
MRDDLARLVYPVLQHGLKLRARIDRGERPMLAAEQAELKRLLGTPSQPAPWGMGRDVATSIAITEPTRFLGVRYALTCWLDELFIESSLSRDWDENKLESALFETNIRYRNFWEQARLAETTPDSSDAVEAFLMCVLLGFRGELADKPEAFREWVAAAKSRAGKGYGKDLPAVPELAPSSNVPLLLGVEGYRKMARALGLTLLAAIFVVTFLLVLWLSRQP